MADRYSSHLIHVLWLTEQFYLPPLPQKRPSTFTLPTRAGPSRLPLPEERKREADRIPDEPDELDLQITRRREIYTHGLYVKASPPFSVCLFLWEKSCSRL